MSPEARVSTNLPFDLKMRTMARQQRWHPTEEQRETAYRLADSYSGAAVRTRPDGSADLRTFQRGALRHYCISPDGTATLLEAWERTWRHPVGYGLLIGGSVLGIAMVVTIIVAQAAHFRTASELHWAMWLVGAGFVLGFAGQTMLSPSSPPGEYWESIGGADF